MLALLIKGIFTVIGLLVGHYFEEKVINFGTSFVS